VGRYNTQHVSVASDSLALTSIKSRKSSRPEKLIEIYQIIYRLYNKGLSIWFVWVPAYVCVKGNEEADMLV